MNSGSSRRGNRRYDQQKTSGIKEKMDNKPVRLASLWEPHKGVILQSASGDEWSGLCQILTHVIASRTVLFSALSFFRNVLFLPGVVVSYFSYANIRIAGLVHRRYDPLFTARSWQRSRDACS